MKHQTKQTPINMHNPKPNTIPLNLFFLPALLAILLYGQSGSAQIQFEQVLPPPPAPQIAANFIGVDNSSIAFADVDGDNDQDVLVTGLSSSGRIAQLYTNDGSGNFSLVPGTPFDGVGKSSIEFADVDGDNDQDVIITGENNFGQPISHLYTNDGSGNFSLVSGTPFDGVSESSIAFADVDGDNDQDVLITGENNSIQRIAKLYSNDGNGNFSLVSGTPFEGLRNGSIAFADVDGDNDQDVLITGDNVSALTVQFYTNDGNGNFTLVSGTPFEGVTQSSIAFADVDGDNDQDVLITGRNSSSQQISRLYTNDGSGNFSLISGTPFDGVSRGSIAFADVDGDNDQDVLIAGDTLTSFFNSERIARLYTNDGSGNFSLFTGTPFDGVDNSSIAFADVDGDNDKDVLITGNVISQLYTNDGNGNFSLVSGTPFDGVEDGSIAFADVDGDGDQDVLITGRKSSSQPISQLYTNDGSGNFSFVQGTPFDGVEKSSIAFADVDGDNDQDVLITGRNSSSQPISQLYTNDGSGNFSLVSGIPFNGVFESSIAFADVDGDNDQDVLITGRNSSNQPISQLYTNDGSGNFSVVSGTPFDGVNESSIAFADVDGDNDHDLLITGTSNSGPISQLYTNDGSGNFSLVSGTPFDGVRISSIAFADVDGDNDKDVLITGISNLGPITKLYTNDGNGNFSLVTGTPFDGVYESSIAFADVDDDNDKDVLITGSGNSIAQFYTNNGSGNFSFVSGTPFDWVSRSSIAFADIDNDADQDVLITGSSSQIGIIAKLYRNISVPCTGSPSASTDVVTACDSFTWIDGVPYTSSNNTATFTLTNAAGCDSVITLDLTIPELSPQITRNDSALSVVDSFSAYQWYIDGSAISGASSFQYEATQSGDYYVQVENAGSCTGSSDTVEVLFSGIENLKADQVRIYPNPFTHAFTVELPAGASAHQLRLLNVQGKEVLRRENITQTSIEISHSALSSGLYLLEVQGEWGIKRQKLVRR